MLPTNSNTNPKKGLYSMQLNAFLNQTVNSIQDPYGWGIFSITSYSVINPTGCTFKTWVIESNFHTQVKLLEDSSNYPTYWDEPIQQLQNSIFAELDSYQDLIRHNLDEIIIYKVSNGGYTITIYSTDSGLIITQAELEY